jgi:hypothetical protein
MQDTEELELAQSMIRLYGRAAETVATGHATTHAGLGETEKSEKWRRVAAVVKRVRLQMQPG